MSLKRKKHKGPGHNGSLFYPNKPLSVSRHKVCPLKERRHEGSGHIGGFYSLRNNFFRCFPSGNLKRLQTIVVFFFVSHAEYKQVAIRQGKQLSMKKCPMWPGPK